jgi:hypothetical protein
MNNHKEPRVTAGIDLDKLDRYGFDGTMGGDFGLNRDGPYVVLDDVRAALAQPRVTEQAEDASQFTSKIMGKLDEYGMAVKDDNSNWRSRVRSEIFNAVYDHAALTRQAAPEQEKVHAKTEAAEAAELQTFLVTHFASCRPPYPAGLDAWALAALRQAAPEAPTGDYNRELDVFRYTTDRAIEGMNKSLFAPATQQAGAAEPCDCCAAIRDAEAIYGDGPAATTASASEPVSKAELWDAIHQYVSDYGDQFRVPPTTGAGKRCNASRDDLAEVIDRMFRAPAPSQERDGPRLSVEECIAQFGMYAESCDALGNKEGARQLRICADFLRDHGPRAPAPSQEAAKFYALNCRDAVDHDASQLGATCAECEAGNFDRCLVANPPALAQQGAAQAPLDASKAVYWFDMLAKCARLLDLPDDEPIPSGVLRAVEKLVAAQAAHAGADTERLQAEVERLTTLLNTPETLDFIKGLQLETAHQRERWGTSHDAGKAPADWFWLIGYLAQKAMMSHIEGSVDKALHHTITTAAALANWHAAILGKNDMRPGIAPPEDTAIATSTKDTK